MIRDYEPSDGTTLYHHSSYSCVKGVMGSWLSVMVNNFGPLNVTDKQIGLIGLFAVFGQCALVTATGLLIDRSDTSGVLFTS